MEEFFTDLKAYGKNNKWMWFDLLVRQPLSLCGFLYIIVNGFLYGKNAIRTWAMVIVLIVWITLAVITLARQKYSYPCWIALLIFQTIVHILNRKISFWYVTIPEIILVFIILYYSNRKDFFFKEASETKDAQNRRKWEIELIVLTHLIFASCMHFSLGSVSEIESMRVYENELLSALGWFLYGGSLYLAFGWEKISQSGWMRTVLKAAGIGILTVTARTVLDYFLGTILLEGWNYRGIMRISLLITGVFCLVFLRLLFWVFARKKKHPLDEVGIPMIAMAVVSLLYLAEYTYSSGWVVDKEDWNYAIRVVLPLYVWIIAFLMMLLWIMMWMRCVKKENVKEEAIAAFKVRKITIKKKIKEGLERAKDFGKYIIENAIKHSKIILIISILMLAVIGISFLGFPKNRIPIWATYPYDVTIENGMATINKYIGEEKEIKVPKMIWGIKVNSISDKAFADIKTEITSLDIPEELEFSGSIFHYGSQSYYYLNGHEAWLTEYVGNDKKIEIPERIWGYKVTRLKEFCFEGSAIEEVMIPDTVTYVGVRAFYRCKDLKKVALPSYLKEISHSAFQESGIESIEIPASVFSIGEEAFKDSLLKEITGIENVECIAYDAFTGTPWGNGLEAE